MMLKKCSKCQKLLSVGFFGFKKNKTIYSRCIKCRTKENNSYIHTKKSFLDDYPNLKKEWDYEKNAEKGLFPENLSYGSNKKVFWKCESGNTCHVWESSIANRTNIKTNSCPFCSNHRVCPCGCNSLWASHPKLRKEWDEEKNGNMKLYARTSNKKVFWKCKTGNTCHVWECSISNRTNMRSGCPFCVNKKICPCGCNSLWQHHPELRDEWDEEKNGSMKLYSRGSKKKVFWICKTGKKCHKWDATIVSRTGKNLCGCVYCSSRRICPCGCNSLWQHHPELRDEWDEEKNGSMKLHAPNSGIKVFWKCRTGNKCHVWKTAIDHRTGRHKGKCPLCSRQKICSCGCNSVFCSHPELREEWDEKKNGNMKLYAPSSNKKVFWICKSKKKGHTWQSTVSNRTSKRNPGGCPYCRKSKLEILFSTICSELDIQCEIQKRYKDCKGDRCLPYDFFLPKYKICVELQGIQHFQSGNFFHRTPDSYINRLKTDSKKVKSAYDRGDSFLSISYIVETKEEMTIIVKNMIKKVKKSQTIRFHITPEIYFDTFSKLSIPIPTENKLLLVYEIYDEQRKMIEGLKYDKKLLHCPYCDEHHLENYIGYHYETKKHFKTLKKIYENLVGMGENGVPIVLEE
jgi:hypothetical protein